MKKLISLLNILCITLIGCSEPVKPDVQTTPILLCSNCTVQYGARLTYNNKTVITSGGSGYSCTNDNGITGQCYDFPSITVASDYFNASPIIEEQNGLGNWVIDPKATGIIDAKKRKNYIATWP